jgi:hypothetical protein
MTHTPPYGMKVVLMTMVMLAFLAPAIIAIDAPNIDPSGTIAAPKLTPGPEATAESKVGLFVIGLGSGRSGTMSLAHLLDQQPDACVTHEARGCAEMPWEVNDDEQRREIAQTRLDRLEQRCGADKCTMVGDVALWYFGTSLAPKCSCSSTIVCASSWFSGTWATWCARGIP